jgi:putative transposase
VDSVKRSEAVKGVVVLPKRGIVERTCGWCHKDRRLRKDYEDLTATSEALIYVAMIHLMVRRIALKTPF